MFMVDPMPPEERVTQVSPADFAKDPQYYLDEVSAGRAVEIVAAGETFVIFSKEDFESYKTTAGLLDRPETRALPKSPTQPEGSARPEHPLLLGALKGLVQIMPGTDLTKPACEDWGED